MKTVIEIETISKILENNWKQRQLKNNKIIENEDSDRKFRKWRKS